MTSEQFRGPFRRSESTGKPFGGDISSEPFPQALYSAALTCGFESQSAFGRALGKKGNGVVRQWYRGKLLPSPQEFGHILVVLRPEGGIFENLVNSWAQVIESKGGIGSGSLEKRLKMSRHGLKRHNDSLINFLKDLAVSKGITFRELSSRLSFPPGVNKGVAVNSGFGLEVISNILQNASSDLSFNSEEVEKLAKAAAKSVLDRIQEGHRFMQISPATVVQAQRNLPCRTYTGPEVAEELHITRERVRQLRKALRLPYLLTEEDVQLLKARQKANKMYFRHDDQGTNGA